MSSGPQGEAPEGTFVSPLEDRLRGLILNNSPSISPIEPPLLAGTAHLEQGESHRRQLSSELIPEGAQSGQASRGGRKRLNQAQRRQMNAQISIPIDLRPAPPGVQRSRGFTPITAPNLQTSPRGQLVREQNEIQPSPQQFSTHSQGLQQASFNRHQSHPQSRQYVAPVTYQGHAVTQQVNPYQLPSVAHGTIPPNNFGLRFTGNHSFLPPDQNAVRPPPQHNRLYQPGPYLGRGYAHPSAENLEQVATQCAFLDDLLVQTVPRIGAGAEEIQEKEQFRERVEQICREAIASYEISVNRNSKYIATSIALKCFGSMASGFATKASDMDLALLTPYSKPSPDSPESAIPRLLEKTLLDMGFGARLLTKTRVPIIKLCENPTKKLMSGLLDERKKWEIGFVSNDTTRGDQFAEDLNGDCKVCGERDEVALSEDVFKESKLSYADSLASLHQKPNQSLIDYYGSANRLLRKLETSNIIGSCETLPEQARIVDDVCRAFVFGLSDESLSARLMNYQAFQLADAAEPTKSRSLRGVFTQMEGEQWVVAWENRLLGEATEGLETDAQRQVDDWHRLLNVITMDSMTYDGQVQSAVLRLKKVASLQLMFLEQALNETPVQYYLRATDISRKLQRQDDDHVRAVVTARYLNGIRNPKIQEILHTMASANGPVSLSSLGIQHRIVQLADDYETALSKGIYSEEDRPDIELYVDFLRSRNAHHDAQVSKDIYKHSPSANSAAALAAKLRNLPDPSPTSHRPRDRYKDHLEFPKSDVGIQCDINFSAQLGLQNTSLLRCYSLTDSRVQPLILFVKFWAKTRAINTPYRGTLSSYGYVLMVLHYLLNVAMPFVCPNLQQLQRDPPPYLSPDEIMNQTTCNGYDVRFWRNEWEITNLAQRRLLTRNNDSPGRLLRGFFEYYAQPGALSTGGRGFDWGRDVLSLRTPDGLLTKAEKGWVGARTVTETRIEAAPAPLFPLNSSPIQGPGNLLTNNGTGTVAKTIVKEEIKEIRHRFLFAIEDPFEIDHNVARTVTHDGIVSIRDEFRRAWRIINNIGKTGAQAGLLDEVKAKPQPKSELEELMDLLHSKRQYEQSSPR